MTLAMPTWPLRAVLTLGRWWCGLTTGHHYIRQPEAARIVLVCWHCNHESKGWSLPEEVADDHHGE